MPRNTQDDELLTLANHDTDEFVVGGADFSRQNDNRTMTALDQEEDWSDVRIDLPQRALIPVGKYPATVREIEHTFSQQKEDGSGNQRMWVWKYTLGYGGENYTLTKRTMLEGAGRPITRRDIETINPDFDFSHFNPVRDTRKLVGRSCRLSVGIKTVFGQDGTPRAINEIKAVLPHEETSSFLE